MRYCLTHPWHHCYPQAGADQAATAGPSAVNTLAAALAQGNASSLLTLQLSANASQVLRDAVSLVKASAGNVRRLDTVCVCPCLLHGICATGGSHAPANLRQDSYYITRNRCSCLFGLAYVPSHMCAPLAAFLPSQPSPWGNKARELEAATKSLLSALDEFWTKGQGGSSTGRRRAAARRLRSDEVAGAADGDGRGHVSSASPSAFSATWPFASGLGAWGGRQQQQRLRHSQAAGSPRRKLRALSPHTSLARQLYNQALEDRWLDHDSGSSGSDGDVFVGGGQGDRRSLQATPTSGFNLTSLATMRDLFDMAIGSILPMAQLGYASATLSTNPATGTLTALAGLPTTAAPPVASLQQMMQWIAGLDDTVSSGVMLWLLEAYLKPMAGPSYSECCLRGSWVGPCVCCLRACPWLMEVAFVGLAGSSAPHDSERAQSTHCVGPLSYVHPSFLLPYRRNRGLRMERCARLRSCRRGAVQRDPVAHGGGGCEGRAQRRHRPAGQLPDVPFWGQQQPGWPDLQRAGCLCGLQAPDRPVAGEGGCAGCGSDAPGQVGWVGRRCTRNRDCISESAWHGPACIAASDVSPTPVPQASIQAFAHLSYEADLCSVHTPLCRFNSQYEQAFNGLSATAATFRAQLPPYNSTYALGLSSRLPIPNTATSKLIADLAQMARAELDVGAAWMKGWAC